MRAVRAGWRIRVPATEPKTANARLGRRPESRDHGRRDFQCFGDADLRDEDLLEVVEAMRTCGAVDGSWAVAREYAERASAALAPLDDSQAKQALIELSEFVLTRQT